MSTAHATLWFHVGQYCWHAHLTRGIRGLPKFPEMRMFFLPSFGPFRTSQAGARPHLCGGNAGWGSQHLAGRQIALSLISPAGSILLAPLPAVSSVGGSCLGLLYQQFFLLVASAWDWLRSPGRPNGPL